MLATAANAAWFAACYPAYRGFCAALDDPRRVQLQLLQRYLRRNEGTAFGKMHGFTAINDLRSFRHAVPIRSYDEFTPWIDRIVGGEQRVLSSERVIRLMPSSGSTRGAKLIPYTRELQREFNRAIGPWIVDLYRRTPKLMGGCAYWSITPVARKDLNREKSSIPIGFDEDSAYLGGMRQRLVNAVMAVPGEVRHLDDIEEFRFATLRHLLARRDLRLISVWHPSFLDLLLDVARTRWNELVDALHQTNPKRAAEVRELGPENWIQIWPNLNLISCWADASAAGPADALTKRFPGVTVQPKGLLATEAFISIPFRDHWPLAICSHFLEFEDDDGQLFLADELRTGAEYGVVVTTAGGLWRYRLGDRVRCDGWLGRTPSIRFVGRNDLVVDQFGEKLSDGFVGRAIGQLLKDAELSADFAMLAPDRHGCEKFYTLFLSISRGSTVASRELAGALDRQLRANPHYAYCRDLNQLGHPRLFRIRRHAYETYVAVARERGQRLGDVKSVALHANSDWSDRFDGDYLNRLEDADCQVA